MKNERRQSRLKFQRAKESKRRGAKDNKEARVQFLVCAAFLFMARLDFQMVVFAEI